MITGAALSFFVQLNDAPVLEYHSGIPYDGS